MSAFAEIAIVAGTEIWTVAEGVVGFGEGVVGFDDDWVGEVGGVETCALEGAVVATGALLDGATLDATLETTETLLVEGALVDELDVQPEISSVAATITAITPYRCISDTPHCGPAGEDFIIASASFDTGPRGLKQTEP